MECLPRLNWENCNSTYDTSLLTFYGISIGLHLFTLITYLIILILDLWKAISIINKIKNIAFKMRLSVILYSLSIIIHHIGLLQKKSYFPIVILELSYNIYCIFLFMSLLLLIRYWIILSNTLINEEKKYKRIVNMMTNMLVLFLSLFMVITDIVFFIRKELTVIIINIQYVVWAAACLLIGILFVIYGTKITNRIAESNNISIDRNIDKIRFWFKFIYLMYTILPIPYAAVYIILMIMNDFNLYPVVWFIVYGFFNLAGPLTGAILYPILKGQQ